MRPVEDRRQPRDARSVFAALSAAGPRMNTPSEGAAAHGEYVRAVEQLIVLVRRRGLMLSAADWHIAQQWAEADIPLTVVCRAVLRAVEGFRAEHGPSRPLPGSLAYFAPAVRDEAALEAQKDLRAAPDDEDAAVLAVEQRTVQRLLADVEAAGKAEAPGVVLDAYRDLWRDLSSLLRRLAQGDVKSLVSEILEAQSDLVRRVWAGAEPEARAAIEAEVERGVERERATLGVEGLRERRDVLLKRAIMERYGLIRIWDQ